MNVKVIINILMAIATILPAVTKLIQQLNDNKDGSREGLKEVEAKLLQIQKGLKKGDLKKEDLKKATEGIQRSLKEIERLKHESDHDSPERQ